MDATEYAAHGLSISLPVEQNDIEAAVEKLLVTLENIDKARTSVVRLLGVVRDSCDHPEVVEVSHTGHLFKRCVICGKEW